MNRKTYMEEKEIQELEQKTQGELHVYLSATTTPRGEVVFNLLRSYRLAASVANVAWKLVEELDAGGASPETLKLLRQAVAAYAPRQFRPFRGDLEYACRVLEDTYDFLSKWNNGVSTTMALMENLYERICVARAALPHARE